MCWAEKFLLWPASLFRKENRFVSTIVPLSLTEFFAAKREAGSRRNVLMLDEDDFLCFSNCEFHKARFELRRDGVKVDVSSKTLDLLALLIENKDKLISREELFETLWPGTVVNEGSLSNAIYEARSAVGDDAQRQEIIQTVRGRGFRFVADLHMRPKREAEPEEEWVAPSRPARKKRRVTLLIQLLLIGQLPDVVLAYVNWLYNSTHTIPDSIRPEFDLVVMFYNPVTFSLGTIGILTLSRRPVRALMRWQEGRGPASLMDRQRTLLLGHSVALLGLSLWVLAGVMYPVLLQAMTGVIQSEGTLQFLASLVLCGLAVTAYPFFLLTWYSLREIYPPLVSTQAEAVADEVTILRLRTLAGGYLLAAGGIPLFTVTLLSFSGSGERWLLGLASVVGLVGLAFSILMHRKLLQRLEDLSYRANVTRASN